MGKGMGMCGGICMQHVRSTHLHMKVGYPRHVNEDGVGPGGARAVQVLFYTVAGVATHQLYRAHGCGLELSSSQRVARTHAVQQTTPLPAPQQPNSSPRDCMSGWW
jgi:hypothetical protein